MKRGCTLVTGVALLFFAVACDKKESSVNDDFPVDEVVDIDTAADQTLPEVSAEQDETDIRDEDEQTPDEDEVLWDGLLLDDQSDLSDLSDDVDAPDDDLCADCIIPAEVTCQPSVAPCDAAPIDANLYASYRKDFYYPHYQEGDVLNPIPAPVNGGRFQIAGVAEKSGEVTAV